MGDAKKGPAVSITAKNKASGERRQIAAIWPSKDGGGKFYIKFNFEEDKYSFDARKVLADLANNGKEAAFYVDPYVNIGGGGGKSTREDDEL